jgi:hypothetical protein
MGDMVMGECKDRQRKFWIAQKNCKHSKGGYGKLPLSDVYTCHGFRLKIRFLLKSRFQNISS